MDKQHFLEDVQDRLGATFSVTADDCARAVLKVLHEAILTGREEPLAAHLPKDVKAAYWGLGIGEVLRGAWTEIDREAFLEAVQEQTGLGSTGEAVHATRAVFAALQEFLPAKVAWETGEQLAPPLRGLWEHAADQGTEPRPEPKGHEYEERWPGGT